MANPGWYNDNANRDWPFLTRVEPITQYAQNLDSLSSLSSSAAGDEGQYVHLPHDAVVDFGAIMEIDAEYTEKDGHQIYLYRVSRPTATTFEYEFRTSAPEAANYRIIFTRNSTDPYNYTTWADATAIASDPPDVLECRLQPRWKAFLVTGGFEGLLALLSTGETLYFATGLWVIEPSRVQSLMDSYLRSCNLANFPRTLATPPSGCDSDSSSAQALEEPILNATCVRGNVKWKEGYNCAIRQDNFNNAIVISAAVGSGEGEPCDEVPLYDGEAPPADSPFLSGGPSCNDILKSLNGVNGRRLTIRGGAGMRIFADPLSNNKLVIDRALDDFALCLAADLLESSLSSESLSSAGGV